MMVSYVQFIRREADDMAKLTVSSMMMREDMCMCMCLFLSCVCHES